MSSHTVISDVSNGIVTLLANHLVPDIIPNADKIYLGNPQENPQASLCVYLYDAQENQNARTNEMVNQGISRQRYPSTYLTLFYMITANSNSDLKFRATEEQKILGRAMQVLNDCSLLDKTTYMATEDGKLDNLRISFLNLEREEKTKIFNFPGLSYKMSAFYCIAPVELQSRKERKVSRVSEVQIDYGMKEI